MNKLRETLTQNGLFLRMFLITVVCVVAVSVAITWATIRMSERFFIETFTITNAKVLNQVRGSFESYHYSVVAASNRLLQNGTVKRILSNEQSSGELHRSLFLLEQQMNRTSSALDAYEADILIRGANGIVVTSERSYWRISDAELARHPITKRTLDEPNRLLYHYDFAPGGYGLGPASRIIVASKAFHDRISGVVYGTMYFASPESEFRRFYSSYTSPGNDVVVLDGSGAIVSSNRTEWIGQQAGELLEYAAKAADGGAGTRIGALNGTLFGKPYIIVGEYLPSFDMYLLSLVDRETAIGEFIDRKTVILIIVAIVSAALVIVFLTSRRLTISLSRLVRQISSVSKYDFHQYVAVGGTYETRQIGHAFNAMLDELHEYVEQLMQSQRQRRHAELAALQQQINPHFLYNTLASIKFMVQQGGKEEAAETINALISLLQQTIGQMDETFAVKQELETLKHYVFINRKRYGDRIKVNFFVAPDCMEYSVPKLILQPFLENAFFHGFNRKPEGTINVMVWREGANLICEVADNGDGMEAPDAAAKLPDTRRKRQLFSGIGVRNVHERVRLMYGDAYGVNIASKIGEGTTVRITLPARREGQ